MNQPRESKSPSASVRLPVALADRVNAIKPMACRVAWVEQAFRVVPVPDTEADEVPVARAGIARPESLVETPVAGVETKMKVALPELSAELSPGKPGEGSAVPSRTVCKIGRGGFGEPEDWPGAVIHVPPESSWFLELDDQAREEVLRRALSACRYQAAVADLQRQISLGHLIAPPPRPEGIGLCWEWVPVWIPPLTGEAELGQLDAALAKLHLQRGEPAPEVEP